jgi:molecular chaperone DnaK (HSP70)
MNREKNIIGKLNIKGINKENSGVKKIEVKLKMDENGIVNVYEKERSNGKYKKIKIYNDKGRM